MFDFAPRMVFVYQQQINITNALSKSDRNWFYWGLSATTIYTYLYDNAHPMDVFISLSNNVLSWYADSDWGGTGAVTQMNLSNVRYYYIGLI